MNGILTGLGLALVTALIAALVGPFFVDWTTYRVSFEEQASRIVGVPVRVMGDVEARILPSPRIRFGHVSVGGEGSPAHFDAETFVLDLALMPLLSGEYRISEVRIDGVEAKAGLAADGTLALPAAGGARFSDLERIAIEKITVGDARLVVSDPTASRDFVFENVMLNGEASSLAGPFKADIEGRTNGMPFRAQASAGRFDPAGGRVKIGIQAEDMPALDLDGTLVLSTPPRFSGNAVLTRRAVAAQTGRPAVPGWKIRAAIKADPRHVAAETLDIQQGDEGSGLHLAGTGQFFLNASPSARVDLSARQLDLDRALGRAKDQPPLPPVEALAQFAKGFSGLDDLPFALRAKLALEGVVLSGDIIQNVRADVVSAPSGWLVERLGFRMPGGGDLLTAGSVSFEGGTSYSGNVHLQAPNAPVLVEWLGGASGSRPDIGLRKLSISGDVSARADGYKLEDMVLDFDGNEAKGSVAWTPPRDGDRGKLDARLQAEGLDLDALGQGRLFARLTAGGAAMPELALAVQAGHMTYAGVDWRGVDVDLTSSAGSTDIKRLVVADLGGARIEAKGRLGEKNGHPDGRLEAKIKAQALDGLVAVLKQLPVSEQAVAALEARTDFIAPAALNAVIEAGGSGVSLRTAGTLGGSPVEFDAKGKDLSLSGLLSASLKASSDDGARLLRQLGVPLASLDGEGPAHVELSLSGNSGDGYAVEAALNAADGRASFRGKAGDLSKFDGRFELNTEDAGHYAMLLGRVPPLSLPAIPVSVGGKLAHSDNVWTFGDVAGFVAGRAVGGRLTYGAKEGIGGEIDLASLSVAEVLGTAIGPLALSEIDDTGWPSGPIGGGLLDGLDTRIAVRTGALEIAPGYIAGKAGFTLAVTRNEFAMHDIEGALAGGKVKGSLAVRKSGKEASVAGRLTLDGASVGDLVWGSRARPAAVGRLALTADALGSGPNLSSVVSSLTGSGTVTIRDGRLSALDPGAFGRVVGNVEAAAIAAPGSAVPDGSELARRFESELSLGDLNVSEIASAFTIASGVLRASNAAISAPSIIASGSADIDLSARRVEAQLSLGAASLPELQGEGTPPITIAFSGPLAGPERRIDTNTLTNFLAVRTLDREVKRVEQMDAERAERARLAAEEDARRRAAEEEAARIRAITESTGTVPIGEEPPPVDFRPPPRVSEPPPSPPARRQTSSPLDFFRRNVPAPEASR